MVIYCLSKEIGNSFLFCSIDWPMVQLWRNCVHSGLNESFSNYSASWIIYFLIHFFLIAYRYVETNFCFWSRVLERFLKEICIFIKISFYCRCYFADRISWVIMQNCNVIQNILDKLLFEWIFEEWITPFTDIFSVIVCKWPLLKSSIFLQRTVFTGACTVF